MRKLAVFIFASLLINGCGLITLKSIPHDSVMRVHNGIVVYAKSDDNWNDIFGRLDNAYARFVKCVGTDWSYIPKSTPVVLIYERPIYFFGQQVGGFTDLKRIYVDATHGSYGIAHEWLHVYLFKSGGYALGDYDHTDPIWGSCGLGYK